MASYTMPESMDVADYANKPGWYHLAVSNIDEAPTKDDGTVYDALKVSVQVLDGEHPDQKRKTTDLWLNNPNPTNKDGGKFLQKVHCRFARAVNVLPAAKPGEAIEINWSNARGQQLVAKLKNKKDSDRLEIDGLMIFHVGDPETEKTPKDANALRLAKGLPAHSTNGHANSNGAVTPASMQPPTTPAAPADAYANM